LDLYVTTIAQNLNVISPDSLPGRHLLYINDVVQNNNRDYSAWSEEADMRGCSRYGYGPTGFGVSFGDYDLDGQIDLAIAQWAYASGIQNTRLSKSKMRANR
jgi:hypothetical protein